MILKKSSLLTFTIPIVFIGVNINILGIGSSLLLVIILSLYKITTDKNTFIICPINRNLFVFYLLFSFTGLYALNYTGNIDSENIRYWFSIFITSIIFIIMPNFSHQGVLAALHKGFIYTATIIIVIWIFNIVYHQDFFILRTFDATNWYAKTLFKNPNLTARISTLVLLTLLFFHRTSKNYKSLTPILLLMLSLLIVSTLSRANTISLITILVSWVILFSQLSKKLILLILLFGIGISTLLYNSTVNQRFLELQNYSFNSEENLRSRSWIASIKIIQNNPLFGIGKSNELLEMESWGSVTQNAAEKVIVTHGGFLKIAVYTGLISAAVLILILIFTLYKYMIIYFKIRSKQSIRKSAAGMGIITIFALIPMNIGADSFGLLITWFVISFFSSLSSCKSRVQVEA